MKGIFKIRLLWLFFSFFLVFGHSMDAQNLKEKMNIADLEKYLEKCRNDWGIPGLSVALLYENEVIYLNGFGVLETGTKRRIDSLTIFGISSNTKAFTSAALARLVDQEKISWDDKVVEYIDYFELYDSCITDRVTIRDLLCHRTGYKTFSGDLLWYKTNYSREEVIRRLKYLEPEYGFREHYGYSNIMYSVAGEIIREVTGLSWEGYIKKEFLDPLDMQYTTTSTEKIKSEKNAAKPHIEVNNEVIALDYMDWNNVAAAAAINSNLVDLAKWVSVWLNNGTTYNVEFFSERQYTEMLSPQTIIPIPKGATMIWPSTYFKTYGLGWELFDYKCKKIVAHSGGGEGVTSQIAMIPSENFAIIILSNKISYIHMPLMYHIIDSFLDKEEENDWNEFFLNIKNMIETREKEEKEAFINNRKQGTTTSLDIERYTGKYTCKLYGEAEIKKENDTTLILDFKPAPELIGKLTHWQDDMFIIKLLKTPNLPKGTVTFEIDSNRVKRFDIDIPNPDFYFTELDFHKVQE